MREENQEAVQGAESVRKPYNLKERKIKNAAYRDMIRADAYRRR